MKNQVALALGFGAFLAACQPPSVPVMILSEPPSEAGLAPAQVALPPVPPLTILDIPRTYDDGSYSISGLMLSREALREEALEVTGIVSEIYQCEGSSRSVEGELAELAASPDEPVARFTNNVGCKMPHLYIVDSLRSSQRLLITGYDPELWEPQLKPGTRYRFDGTYSQRAPGFLSTEYGLLLTENMEGSGVYGLGEGSVLVPEEAP
jgi:hypothetical protein